MTQAKQVAYQCRGHAPAWPAGKLMVATAAGTPGRAGPAQARVRVRAVRVAPTASPQDLVVRLGRAPGRAVDGQDVLGAGGEGDHQVHLGT